MIAAAERALRSVWHALKVIERATFPGAFVILAVLGAFIAFNLGLISSKEATAAANTAWALISGGAALVAHLLWKREGATMDYAAREMVLGARLGGACVFLHRMWWNFGIWLREDGEAFWPVVADNSWVTAVLVAGIIRGIMRATNPILRKLFPARCCVLVDGGIAALVCLSILPA